MKIAINLSRESVGGITTSNLNLIKYLYKNNIQTFGVELNSDRHTKGSTIYRKLDPLLFDHNIISIHDFNFRELVKKGKSLKELEVLYKEIIDKVVLILKEDKPDAFVISGTYYIPWLLSIAAVKAKVPIILWYSGVLTKEVEHFKPYDRKIYGELEKSIIKRARKIIFPSELCQKTVETSVTKKRVLNAYVIPNSVAREFLEETAVNYSVGRSLASVGRYTPIKNFKAIFDIHKILKKEKWEHECNFVTNVDKQKIKGIPKSVSVFPSMDKAGLRRFYVAQGLIICPSLFETFGNVPMEAVCMGVPVLVSDQMGCAEVLKKAGLSNMVVSFENVDVVVKKVKELCGQSILPKQLNALRRILDANFVHEKIKAIIISALDK